MELARIDEFGTGLLSGSHPLTEEVGCRSARALPA
jgi:hypothetical protein